jgi:uncharacterized protein (TIGR04255 family)
VRFLPNFPDEAIFGLLYESLSPEFPKLENLPALQLPPQMRNLNPQFRFQPTHRLRSENYYVAVGSNVVTIGIQMPYPGWTAFRARLISVFEAVIHKAVAKQLQRLGFRYVNVFEGDVTSRLTLETRLAGHALEGKETTFRTTLERDNNNITLLIAKNQTVKRAPDFKRDGTLIDIDVFRGTSEGFELSNLTEFIDNGHTAAKTLFFELLRSDFLNELHPTY